MNQQTQAVDSLGRIHTVMWHCSDESYAYARPLGYSSTGTWGPAVARRFNHYWRDTNGQWHRYEMPWVAGRIADGQLALQAPPIRRKTDIYRRANLTTQS